MKLTAEEMATLATEYDYHCATCPIREDLPGRGVYIMDMRECCFEAMCTEEDLRISREDADPTGHET